MGDGSLIKKQARKAAFIIGIVSFLGFSVILFTPQMYMMSPFTPYIILAQLLLFSPIGLLEASILGLVTYFVFKHLKSKLIYRISLVIGIIIFFPIGFFSNVCLFRLMTTRPPYMNEIDTNQDGKIDKWVHHYGDFSAISTMSEIDIDYDGTPDIKKYYDNGELVKKEYYKNGELIKTEEFPVVRKNKR